MKKTPSSATKGRNDHTISKIVSHLIGSVCAEFFFWSRPANDFFRRSQLTLGMFQNPIADSL